MHSLTIAFGSTMWSLLFKSEEPARAAYNMLLARDAAPLQVVRDDFGHELLLNSTSIHGVVLEDLELTKLAHCERALHQQRMQIQAQNMAQADATIRAARFQQGPAMIQPMGPNGGFPRS